MRSRLCRAAFPASILLLLLLTSLPVEAQYFGRNKVQYDDFHFRVLPSEHFDFYFYPEARVAVEDAARMGERWYDRHQRTFLRTFREKKPVILYANDADFQQTNVIRGSIGQGTGGVTESIKERVTMPLTGYYKDTDHVLGHELVHSFQYDIALNSGDSTRFQLNRIPLWLVEGMAEYLSIGRHDAHTAMWLRDALIRDDLPTIDQLSRGNEYFPYRYGQAYMAYVGGRYGDAAVTNIYKFAGRMGVDSSIVYTLGITDDSLSAEWKRSVRDLYGDELVGRTLPDDLGEALLSEENEGGRINVSPVISPDGRHVAFLSERDLFSINLFIADTETGEVIKRLGSPSASPHFDALRFINSAGTWSPNGDRLAFVSFEEGDNRLAIWNVKSGDVERRIKIPGVTALSNPAWSPDGRQVAITGLDGGISDLYVIDLQTREVRQLTDDRYADLQPAWSPDGTRIAFATDRGPNGTDFSTLDYAQPRLGIIDVSSREITTFEPFGREMHHNPVFSPDGQSLYFISNQDGFKDIYRLDLQTEMPSRITNLATGVSGITELSPALSVARETGDLVFSVFVDNEYRVYTQAPTEGEPVQALPEGQIAVAGILPPPQPIEAGLVGGYLGDPRFGLPESTSYDVRGYTPSLHLDFVAPPTVGASFGGPYGGGLSGGVGFYFSDMLGNHNLNVVAQANGTLKDIGGQVSYANLGNRLNYATSASHIPIRFSSGAGYVDRNGDGVDDEFVRAIQRIYYDNVSGGAIYPFSTIRRAEASLGFVRYGFDYEVERYLRNGEVRIDDYEEFVDETGVDFLGPVPEPLYFGTASLAMVGDWSNFGFTSPVAGGRYRFEVTPYVGTQQFVQGLADYRQYFFRYPFTFAMRGLHVGNYGAELEGRGFADQYLGYSYYPGFVRGYSFGSFEEGETCRVGSCPLIGTHIALASAEVRVPLFGTEAFGLVNFPYLPTEIALFTDAGVAWQDKLPVLEWHDDLRARTPVVSSGITARINVLGYVIFETFYAYPYQRPDKGAHFGFVLRPGW